MNKELDKFGVDLRTLEYDWFNYWKNNRDSIPINGNRFLLVLSAKIRKTFYYVQYQSFLVNDNVSLGSLSNFQLVSIDELFIAIPNHEITLEDGETFLVSEYTSEILPTQIETKPRLTPDDNCRGTLFVFVDIFDQKDQLIKQPPTFYIPNLTIKINARFSTPNDKQDEFDYYSFDYIQIAIPKYKVQINGISCYVTKDWHDWFMKYTKIEPVELNPKCNFWYLQLGTTIETQQNTYFNQLKFGKVLYFNTNEYKNKHISESFFKNNIPSKDIVLFIASANLIAIRWLFSLDRTENLWSWIGAFKTFRIIGLDLLSGEFTKDPYFLPINTKKETNPESKEYQRQLEIKFQHTIERLNEICTTPKMVFSVPIALVSDAVFSFPIGFTERIDLPGPYLSFDQIQDNDTRIANGISKPSDFWLFIGVFTYDEYLKLKETYAKLLEIFPKRKFILFNNGYLKQKIPSSVTDLMVFELDENTKQLTKNSEQQMDAFIDLVNHSK